MTDDVDLLRLAAHVEAAGAKMASSATTASSGRWAGRCPGGAGRPPAGRRPCPQREPPAGQPCGTPGALGAAGGEADKAVGWYVKEERVHAVPGRDEALRSAVIAWASDVEAGHDTGLYAWRRANVAELNALARRWMADSGRLSGPELATPDGASYRAGDHVVALAPSRDGALVTSQRATVEAVDLSQNTLALRTADGRHVNLSAEDAGADRLGHAYATTVHRSQGATTTRAHLFADGGGRELAYVAMSRAREGTQVWTVADDLAQAREDLAREWSSERRPTWAIDIGLPGAGQLDRTALATLPVGDRVHAIAVVGAQARLSADAMRAALPADPSRSWTQPPTRSPGCVENAPTWSPAPVCMGRPPSAKP